MRAAESKSFNVIVAEDMDRIFRDQADYHAARKRLDFLGVAIHTAGGKVGRFWWSFPRHSRADAIACPA